MHVEKHAKWKVDKGSGISDMYKGDALFPPASILVSRISHLGEFGVDHLK